MTRGNRVNRLDELTRKDLIKDVDKWTKDKSKKVTSANYKGVTKDYTVVFSVPSVTASPSTKYSVRIKLLDYPDVAKEEDLSVKEKVRLAIAGDLKISCTCPAFLYFGYKYILTQLDANNSEDERRFPKIKNPNLHGVMCKHCYKAMNAFPFTWTSIARDIDKEHFLN